MPYGTNEITVSSIKVSDKVTASIEKGGFLIFKKDNKTVISVTAQDGSERFYTIILRTSFNTEKDVKTWSSEALGKEYPIAFDGNKGSLTLPYGTDLSKLKVKTLTLSAGATASVTVNSFLTVDSSTSKAMITVTAEDKTVQSYTIAITLTIETPENVDPITFDALRDLVNQCKQDNSKCSQLSRVNTSNITDMSDLFKDMPSFNADIRRWDTSKVINMGGMFNGATSFNQSLNRWDTSKVRNMYAVFLKQKALTNL